MKVTVTLLSKDNILKNCYNNIRNIFNIFTKNIITITALIIISCMLTIVAKYIKVPKEIINLATNFRSKEEINIKLSDVIAIKGIFNANNYLIKKEVESEENPIDSIKEENLRKIDVLAEGKNEVQVFANKNINYQITENSNSLQRISLANMKILNYSSKRNINFSELVEGIVNLTKKSDSILIYSTHTSESYANSEGYQFEYSGIRRSRDANYNVLAVGNEFTMNLKSKGFNVVHNTTPHDYGTYNSAYSRSRITVNEALQKFEKIGISIDLHRDAIENLDFRPSVNINGVDVAQCMFVIGVGYDESSNPYYQDNLKLALKLQYIADEIYPGLFRPMIIRDSVYNQDLNKYSILIEVGASGNTFDEAFYATRCLTNLLNIMYKD